MSVSERKTIRENGFIKIETNRFSISIGKWLNHKPYWNDELPKHFLHYNRFGVRLMLSQYNQRIPSAAYFLLNNEKYFHPLFTFHSFCCCRCCGIISLSIADPIWEFYDFPVNFWFQRVTVHAKPFICTLNFECVTFL